MSEEWLTKNPSPDNLEAIRSILLPANTKEPVGVTWSATRGRIYITNAVIWAGYMEKIYARSQSFPITFDLCYFPGTSAPLTPPSVRVLAAALKE